ncbi:hypothetical protein JNUCC31_24990 [Paenibacillus sp. JNUCC31]|uniref:hypothetical protein n=1 Tax=Paenibacillus sp. JNUCC-31 TaxID=2777983 RepID=UPI0017863B92|nr:hypothetical protein [Paenibacillus sp. JNUCC-31]QOS77926.1 hypothetical protein JNUCC31_24750 [Paenibacillus sp. JNUCC-31]QOS77967.1 hypothetical protein JNUCC31_24990 [Paenibacillus sp. JNUCC-31]
MVNKKEKRPKLQVIGHYRMIDGIKVKIDPFKTDLPDRCKLIVSEIVTGQTCSLVKVM